jgi:hypothetical protein
MADCAGAFGWAGLGKETSGDRFVKQVFEGVGALVHREGRCKFDSFDTLSVIAVFLPAVHNPLRVRDEYVVELVRIHLESSCV